jgi:hypothetical protein
MKGISLVKLNIHTFTGELSKEISPYHIFIYGNNIYMRNMKCFLHKSFFSLQRIRSYSILENSQRRQKNVVHKTLNNYQTQDQWHIPLFSNFNMLHSGKQKPKFISYKICSLATRRTKPPFQWVMEALYLCEKQPGHEAEHSPLFCPKAKRVLSF